MNGRSLGRQPAGAEHRFRAEFETTYEPGVLAAVAWRDGEEIGRAELRSATGPVLLDVARRPRGDRAPTPSDLAFVEMTLVDEAGSLHTAADRRGHGRASTVPACSRVSAARTRHRGRLHRRRVHDVRRSRARGRPPHRRRDDHARGDGRRLRTGARQHRARVDRGPAMTWELRWHPFRAEWVLFTVHRGARPWIGEVVAHDEVSVTGRQRARAARPAHRHDEPRLPRRVRVHQRPAGVLARRARAVGGRRPVPHAPRGRHRGGRLLPPRPDPVDGRPRRRRSDGGRRPPGASEPARSRRATTSRTCSSSRTAAPPSAPRTRIRTARSTRARSCTGPWRARPRSRPSTSVEPGARCSPTSCERELAGPRVISEGEHFFACVPWFARVRVRGARAPSTAGDIAGRSRRRRVPFARARAARRRPALRRAVEPAHAVRARGAPGAGRRPPALPVPRRVAPATAGAGPARSTSPAPRSAAAR